MSRESERKRERESRRLYLEWVVVVPLAVFLLLLVEEEACGGGGGMPARGTMVGSCRSRPLVAAAAVSSNVEQFHRLVRNWNLHSSIARLAPVWTLIMKPGCFLQNWTCFVSNVSANWSQIDGVPIAADATALDLDKALQIESKESNRLENDDEIFNLHLVGWLSLYLFRCHQYCTHTHTQHNFLYVNKKPKQSRIIVEWIPSLFDLLWNRRRPFYRVRQIVPYIITRIRNVSRVTTKLMTVHGRQRRADGAPARASFSVYFLFFI